MADSEAIHGAPVSPGDPPHTSTLPAANLVDSRPRRGISSATRAEISPTRGSTGPPAGIPISTTWTEPECVLPGSIHSPGLPALKVAVARALAAGPATSPEDASTPLGTSHATTHAPESPARLIASIAPAAG